MLCLTRNEGWEDVNVMRYERTITMCNEDAPDIRRKQIEEMMLFFGIEIYLCDLVKVCEANSQMIQTKFPDAIKSRRFWDTLARKLDQTIKEH